MPIVSMSFVWSLVIAVLLVCALDRLWLRHVARHLDPDAVAPLPLFDPDGYLELIARMTELCHGDRVRVEALICHAQQRQPQSTYAQAVQAAMRQLMAPQAAGRMPLSD